MEIEERKPEGRTCYAARGTAYEVDAASQGGRAGFGVHSQRQKHIECLSVRTDWLECSVPRESSLFNRTMTWSGAILHHSDELECDRHTVAMRSTYQPENKLTTQHNLFCKLTFMYGTVFTVGTAATIMLLRAVRQNEVQSMERGKILFSGTWIHAVWQTFSDISEKFVSSIFR
jgi:hypothetical protein